MPKKQTKKSPDSPNRTAEKNAKFRELGAKRTGKILTGIRSLRKLANKSSYAYSEAEVNKMLAAISDELKACANDFKAGTAPAADGFNWDDE